MYPEIMVIPMREELTRMGVQELRSAEDVDRAIASQAGTTMVVVNSICGCAPREDVLRVRWTRQRSHRPCSQLLYGISSVVALDRVAPRRKADSYDPA
jgi:putative YphP/YqiW family bacilliredoxin